MENLVINRGNPRRVEIAVLGANGVQVELSRCTEVELVLWVNGRSKRAQSVQVANDILIAELSASELDYLGEYSAQVKFAFADGEKYATERVYLFRVANEFFRTASGMSENQSMTINISAPLVTYDRQAVEDMINATQDAIESTANANNAAMNAEAKATLAQNNANLANAAATTANNSAVAADAKASLAQSAADNANAKATLAQNATTAAQTATTQANTARDAANTAATNANNAATAANSVAQGIDAKIATKANQSDLDEVVMNTNTLTNRVIMLEEKAESQSIKTGTFDEAVKLANENPDVRFDWLLNQVIDGESVRKIIYHTGGGAFIDSIGATVYIEPAKELVWTVKLLDGVDTAYFPVASGVQYDCIIDWGDGSTQSINSVVAIKSIKHTYTGNVGSEYKIRCTGSIPVLWLDNASYNGTPSIIYSLDSNTLDNGCNVKIGNLPNVVHIGGTFLRGIPDASLGLNMPSLTSVDSDLFRNSNITDIQINCKSLKSLPDDIFENTNISKFRLQCPLSSIPTSLKSVMPRVTSLYYGFYDAGSAALITPDLFESIPDGVLTDVRQCFRGITTPKLTGDAKAIYDVLATKVKTDALTAGCFLGSTMSNINLVPSSWK